ncbi:hypothetical protein QYB79_002716 [Clostridium perfringens]|uniref:hypothetical protein n=1 Tax=Clostridium perfringens TaxID=1502 RepID=UPI0028599651|nr:hypothetical protein [Clostridium perfringens]ELC8440670.1 hypothetical protein [Clostridium perfringens]
MNFKSKILGATLLAAVSVGSITNVAYASDYVHQNGTVYVTNWDNYSYNSCHTRGITLKDEYGNNPTFAQNSDYDWVSNVVTVRGYGCFPFRFYPYNDRVKVYDFDTRKEINDGYLVGGQRIYIVSKDDPTYIILNI